MSLNYSKKIVSTLSRLFHLNRSITGKANRETLKILKEIIPLNIIEYNSGIEVYDWKIPKEWILNDAWIKDSKGKKLIDFHQNNLHVVSYSNPVEKKLSFEELKPFLHKSKSQFDAIPYRTSYYNKNWGFCLSSRQYNSLKNASEPFYIKIDSEFEPNGSLSVGELFIPGISEEEILISTYFCHPSMANDNLSGTILTAFLAKELLKKENLHYSYRIIWVPETIGAIAYSFMNEKKMKLIKAGFVITTVGGTGRFGFKMSYDPNHFLNSLVEEVFEEDDIDFITYPFDIHGSDERQYSSPSFRINTVTITKDKYYEYDYYHTSLDNLDFVKGENINKSLNLYLKCINKIEEQIIYITNYPNCEVMLSKHNLYPKLGGEQLPDKTKKNQLDIILWLLFWCDGKKTLKQISSKIKVEYEEVKKIALMLEKKKIIKRL